MAEHRLKNWQQCSLTISAQDWFLNRWQPLWKIQVQFLVKMRSRFGMKWEQNTQLPFKKLDFSSSQLVMKFLFPTLHLSCAAESPWWAAVI